MIHGMIDLETLSTRPDAVVLTLGGIKFDPYTDQAPHDPLYFRWTWMRKLPWDVM